MDDGVDAMRGDHAVDQIFVAGIADDVYGKKQKYTKLQNYNKKLIKNPNRIVITIRPNQL
mgnify:CR=1 FL=1